MTTSKTLINVQAFGDDNCQMVVNCSAGQFVDITSALVAQTIKMVAQNNGIDKAEVFGDFMVELSTRIAQKLHDTNDGTVINLHNLGQAVHN